ncbi:MAG: hypothetical protein BAJALOKI2v1_90074 [Promethearchaeota archaeon]|nr:MAG: hypothetical protein BAJALOKI2v1_90074 [Candidatus Lokiarchaeota archaeon]
MNIILLVADTFRYKNCGFNGYKPSYSENKASPTPNIDNLAEKSILFDNFYSQINCTHPSFTTMLSGRYPISHTIISHASLHEIIDGVVMFPEILRDNGIKTVAIDNMYRWFVKGFQDYIHPVGENAVPNSFIVEANQVVDKGINWLESHNNEDPFFMMLHFWDPHVPYSPPKEYEKMYYNGNPKNPTNPDTLSMNDIEEKLDLIFKGFQSRWERINDINYYKAQYDAEIAFMDKQIGRFIEYLKDNGYLEDTMLIFTADHGESMGENDIYFTHVHLYDQMMHLPLLIHYPKKYKNSNGRIQPLVGNVDLAPTILELYGLEVPEYFEGKSFVPLLENGGDHHREKIYMFEHEAISRRGVRTKKWKFIKNARNPKDDIVKSRLQALGYIALDVGEVDDKELYDLENDPEEEENIIEEHPEIAKELEEDLETFVEEIINTVGIEDPQQQQDLEPWGEFDDARQWLLLLNERNQKFKTYDP